MRKFQILSNLICVFSVFIILLGLIVLIGWYIHSATLIQISSSFAPMQFNTALGFFLLGISLLLFQKKLETASIVIGTLVLLLGALTLTEYIFSINLGLDEFFMKHYIVTKTSHPGRMAPNTALCFTLSAFAMISLSQKTFKRSNFSGVIAFLVFGLGLVAFAGYFIGMEVTYGWGKLTKMAIHTAFGFVISGICITTMSWINISYDEEKLKRKIPIWLLGYASSLIITLFLIDVATPLGIADGSLYIILVLFGWFMAKPIHTIILALIASALIIIGFNMSPEGNYIDIAVINRGLSIFAVWTTAVLLYLINLRGQKLNDINTKLLEKNKELEQFVYITSHDLQEPLRTNISMIDRLKNEYKDKFDDRGSKYLFYINQSANRMSNLIKGLLDYSRIGLKSELVPVNCNNIIKNIQSDLQLIIKETGTQFTIHTLPVLPAYEVELGLLFQNLVTNSIKFRKENTAPHIKISAKKEKQYWVFKFSDNGIGIDFKYHESIFMIFTRLHTQSSYEGTGIGLAHCKKVVDLHKGNIWVDSEKDKGSTFYIKLPSKPL